jgi:hypothetical protein
MQNAERKMQTERQIRFEFCIFSFCFLHRRISGMLRICAAQHHTDDGRCPALDAYALRLALVSQDEPGIPFLAWSGKQLANGVPSERKARRGRTTILIWTNQLSLANSVHDDETA